MTEALPNGSAAYQSSLWPAPQTCVMGDYEGTRVKPRLIEKYCMPYTVLPIVTAGP